MKMNIKNKKGVALVLVAILIVVAVPITLVLINLSTSQKEQTTHYHKILNLEQNSLQGSNIGYIYLKNNENRGNPVFLYNQNLGSNFDTEHFDEYSYDLNVTPTGMGFFRQDLYLILSKAKDKDNKMHSIIISDAEQFQPNPGNPVPLVITHDYWTTTEPYELGDARDIISIKNLRGENQLTSLEIKKFEMESDESSYKNALESLNSNLPKEIKEIWPTVINNLVEDKINKGNTMF